MKLQNNKYQLPKVKVKKDRIFILVMVIIVANLSYQLLSTLYGIFTNTGKQYNLFYLGLLVFVDAIGIYGVLWLLRSYRRTLKLLKKQKEEELKNEDTK